MQGRMHHLRGLSWTACGVGLLNSHLRIMFWPVDACCRQLPHDLCLSPTIHLHATWSSSVPLEVVNAARGIVCFAVCMLFLLCCIPIFIHRRSCGTKQQENSQESVMPQLS